MQRRIEFRLLVPDLGQLLQRQDGFEIADSAGGAGGNAEVAGEMDGVPVKTLSGSIPLANSLFNSAAFFFT